jgi:hypothetical protein
VAQEIRELEGKVGEIDKTIAGFCKELGIEAPFTVVEDVSNGAKASFKNFVLPWKTTTINGKVDIISGFLLKVNISLITLLELV